MEAHPRSVRACAPPEMPPRRPEVCAHGRRINNLRDEGSGEHRDLQAAGHGGGPRLARVPHQRAAERC